MNSPLPVGVKIHQCAAGLVGLGCLEGNSSQFDKVWSASSGTNGFLPFSCCEALSEASQLTKLHSMAPS